MTPDFQVLCKSLLHCIDTGNKEAEESVLCRIRVALRDAEIGTLVTATTMPNCRKLSAYYQSIAVLPIYRHSEVLR